VTQTINLSLQWNWNSGLRLLCGLLRRFLLGAMLWLPAALRRIEQPDILSGDRILLLGRLQSVLDGFKSRGTCGFLDFPGDFWAFGG
jgi:hypothetical protein